MKGERKEKGEAGWRLGSSGGAGGDVLKGRKGVLGKVQGNRCSMGLVVIYLFIITQLG